MGRWWRWAAVGVPTGLATSAVMTLFHGSWGWDFAARGLIISVGYTLMGPLTAHARRHAEERDAQHMRDIREARRDGG